MSWRPYSSLSSQVRDERRFTEALSEGPALSLERAVAYAHRGPGSHTQAVSGWASLTPAESGVRRGLTRQPEVGASGSPWSFVPSPPSDTLEAHALRTGFRLDLSRLWCAAVGVSPSAL
jgi:hypothetical protein